MIEYPIVFVADGTSHQLCSIEIDGSGSYAIHAPYHSAGVGTLFLGVSVQQQPNLVLSESLRSCRLSHSLRGRLRLSRDPDGVWKLKYPADDATQHEVLLLQLTGASPQPEFEFRPEVEFQCTFYGLGDYPVVDPPADGSIVFDDRMMAPMRDQGSFDITGCCFPADWREFLIWEHERWIIRLNHDNRGVMQMRALLPPTDSAVEGFVGIHLRRGRTRSDGETGFAMKAYGSTGETTDGKPYKTIIGAMYPDASMTTATASPA